MNEKDRKLRRGAYDAGYTAAKAWYQGSAMRERLEAKEEELANLKELVFGDEVREKIVDRYEKQATTVTLLYIRAGVLDFQQAIKEAMEKPIPHSKSQERRFKAQEKKP